MKHKRYLLLLALLIGVSGLTAQTPVRKLSGYLLARADSSALVQALVQLHSSGQAIASAFTSEAGYFELTPSQVAGQLIISYLGGRYQIPLPKEVKEGDLGRIYISLSARELAGVQVRGRRDLVRYEEGKVIYHLDALAGIQGADVLEALGRLPGLRFDSQRGLQLNGLTALAVLVDHRPLRLSVEELESYLRTLSVSEVASVELIQNPGAEYGTLGQPVLHIRTKRHSEDGYQGYASLRGELQHYLREQASVRLNLNRGISRSYVGYSFNDFRLRETTEFVGLSTTHAEVLPRRTHGLSAGSYLRLGVHSIDGNLYGTWQTEDFRQGEPYRIALKRPKLYGSLQYSYRGERLTGWVTAEGSIAELRQQALTESAQTGRDCSSFVRVAPTVTYRLGAGASIYGGATYEQTWYRYLGEGWGEPYRLREGQYLGFVGFNASWRGFSLQSSLSSLSYQGEARSGGKASQASSDWTLLPYLSLSYSPVRNHQITGELKSYYTRPAFRDLAPVTSPVQRSWSRTGNADLVASQSRVYVLRYSYMQAAQLEFSYTAIQRPIVELPTMDSRGNVLLQKVNLDYSRYWRGVLVLPVPLVQGERFRWLATSVGALQRQWDRGWLRGQVYDEGFTTYYVNHRHDLSYGTWTLGWGATMYGPLNYGLYQMERTWWMEASLAKRLGAWRLTAQVRDPLGTNTARGSFARAGVPLSFVRDWHLPQLSLSVSYSFGRSSLRGYQDRSRRDGTDRMRSEGNEGVAQGVGH